MFLVKRKNVNGSTSLNGGVPGAFGLNAHIPMFVMLPNRDGIE